MAVKACIAVLRDFNTICHGFYQTNGSNITEVYRRIIDVDAVLHKLISRLPEGVVLDARISMEEGNSDRETLQAIPCRGRRFELLISIVEQIRAFEKSFSFQRQLWCDKNEVAKKIKCTVDQFA